MKELVYSSKKKYMALIVVSKAEARKTDLANMAKSYSKEHNVTSVKVGDMLDIKKGQIVSLGVPMSRAVRLTYPNDCKSIITIGFTDKCIDEVPLDTYTAYKEGSYVSVSMYTLKEAEGAVTYE